TALAKQGKLRIIAVSGDDARLPDMPDVANITELAPGWVYPNWTGLIAAAGVPRPIIDRWNHDLREILATPEMQKIAVTANGAPWATSTPEGFGAVWQRESAILTRVTKQLGIVPQEL